MRKITKFEALGRWNGATHKIEDLILQIAAGGYGRDDNRHDMDKIIEAAEYLIKAVREYRDQPIRGEVANGN